MRSDAKLGLALGMLVIGFAVAFCFPRVGQNYTHKKPVAATDRMSETISIEPTVNQPAATVEVSSNSGLAEILPSQDLHQTETEEILPTPARTPNSDSQRIPRTYQVQQGDTLSGISMKLFGNYSRYLDIYQANRDQLSSPEKLRLGQELRIPGPVSESGAPATDALVEVGDVADEGIPGEVQPENQPKFRSPNRTPFLSERKQEHLTQQIQQKQVRVHVVQPGDSLERIAVQHFGTVRAVEQLRRANPDATRDPRRLKPGTVLNLVP